MIPAACTKNIQTHPNIQFLVFGCESSLTFHNFTLYSKVFERGYCFS